MFIVDPDQYLLPDYKISPFSTEDMFRNEALAGSLNFADEYFRSRFSTENFRFTYNGRSALNKALTFYRLQPNDLVTILTTSGNSYISSCVTGEVSKHCGWNREITPATKVILVIHEFGYPYEDLDRLTEHNIPIIEDCAYSFFSDNSSKTLGKIGDFTIFSFPKMFPMQIGGLVSSKHQVPIEQEVWPTLEMENYVKRTLSFYLQEEENIILKRLENYEALDIQLSKYGFHERFPLKEGVIPGVYLFNVNDGIDLPSMKDFLAKHGIQCSVFYGERAFFLPIHQRLSKEDLKYFVFVIKSFLERNVKSN